MQMLGQCSRPMVDLGACLDDDRALALIDGQLSPRAREEVEAHLDACASCRRFVSELAKESLFESAKVAPTDLEKTGYAPGRPQLLDVALTARDLAATRVGVPDATAPGPEPRVVEPRDARVDAPRSVPPAPAADSQRPISVPAPAHASGLSRSHVVVLSIAVALAVLTGLAALISVGALGYTLLDP